MVEMFMAIYLVAFGYICNYVRINRETKNKKLENVFKMRDRAEKDDWAYGPPDD